MATDAETAEARAGITVALLSASGVSLILFRGDLMRMLSSRGVRVLALAPDLSSEECAKIRGLGATPIKVSLDRTGMRPLRDLWHLVKLAVLLRRLKPDVLFSYFIKPVIYGSMAAAVAGVHRRYAVIAGLGYIYTEGTGHDGWKKKALRWTVSALYRTGLRACHRVFFLNSDDLDQFTRARIVSSHKTFLLASEGVNLVHFSPQPPVSAPVRFLLIARLLREKGLREFAEAARVVRARHPSVEFHLVGGWDPNPGSIDRDELDAWIREAVFDWHGEVKDVRPMIAGCSVFVLPSYREGKPRSTQEAMAMAKPIITTHAPGCRDTVIEGVNGFKVPVKDSHALAEAMLRFVAEPALIAPMGQESRRIAEELFDVEIVNRQLLSATDVPALLAILAADSAAR